MYLVHGCGWDTVFQRVNRKLTRTSKWWRIRGSRCRWLQRFCQKTGKQIQYSRRTIHSHDRSSETAGWPIGMKQETIVAHDFRNARGERVHSFFFFSFKRNVYARATHRAASRANVAFWATPTRSEKQLLRTRPRIETLLIYGLASGGYNIDRTFFFVF